jgi:GTPase
MSEKRVGMIVIAGRPNVGKSTLVNRIVGEAVSIVTPKAQTTRQSIRGVLTEERGQLVFIDTPGLHRAKVGGINETMIDAVRLALEDPDAVIYMVDPASEPKHEEPVREVLVKVSAPLVLCVNKTDLRSPPAWTAEWAKKISVDRGEYRRTTPLLHISAETGDGVGQLLGTLFEFAKPGPFLYGDEDQWTDQTVRQITTELIRKQLMMCLGDEIPYSTAVEIDEFNEREKPVQIHCTIYCERDSQKGMIIGAGGKKIKEIGASARPEIEKLVGEKVFLGLRVKVAPEWTKNANQLKRFGYKKKR